MALESHSDDLDIWPPINPTHDVWKKAWESIFRETQARLAQERPELAQDISLLTEEYMILEFHKALNADSLTVMHGMRIPMEGRYVGVKLSRAASNEILNELDPAWRIELAREMVWTHVIDVMDAADNEEDAWVEEAETTEEDEGDAMPWKDSNGEGGVDYSMYLEELNRWTGDEDYEERLDGEEFDDDDAFVITDQDPEMDEEDNGAFVEAANADPSLRELYFALLKGKIDAKLK